MYLIQTSQDLLFLVLAFCALWLTIFLAWFIYYLAMIMRQLFHMIKDTRDRLNKIDELIKTIKEKIEHSASYLALIGEGVKKLIEIMRERKDQKSKKSKKN